MFRKPKQRNLRNRTEAGGTEDELSPQKMGVSNPIVMQQQQTVTATTTTTTTTTVYSKSDGPKSLLSFVDDAGDVEEFKINKSRESRKMTKEVKKQQQQQQQNTSVESKPIPVIQPTTSSSPVVEEVHSGELEIKFKPLQIVNKKETTNSFTSTQADLQRLRQEMKILNGREIGDTEMIEGDFEGNDDDEDVSVLDETQRSVKLMLRSGVIPDSAMIHAARKRRQMARETGSGGGAGSDYITLNDSNADDVSVIKTVSANRKSRLIRDDDNDVSDDSGTEDPHIVSMDRNKTRAASERQKNRDRFLELEQGSDNEDDDEEFRRFEREQIRKGVRSTTAATKTTLSLPSSSQFSQANGKKTSSALVEPQPMEVEITREIPPLDLPPVTFDDIRDRLRESLVSIEESHEKHKFEYEKIGQAYEASQTSMKKSAIDYPRMESAYQFYQQCRGYIYAFVECYNEKMVIIDALEQRWLQLYKQRTAMIVSRRQEDVKDQCIEYSCVKATATSNDFRTPLDPKRQWRATEREARRLRRRKDREQLLSTQHFDGMSTDDEENQSDINLFTTQRNEILAEAEHVFDDISDEFCRYTNVKSLFEQWKFEQRESYDDAFIESCLPKLFSPLIRKEIIDWRPFEISCQSFDHYTWHRELLFYGVKDGQDEAEPFEFIPMVIEKVIIPKLTTIIENIYDPLSAKQTTNLIKTIESIFQIYPTMTDDSKNVQTLLKAIVDRLQLAVDDDIYIPIYPKEMIALGSTSSNTSSNRSASIATEFFFRQYWTCVKLLGNITAWSQILSLKTILDLSVDGLLNRYILLALKQMDLTSSEMTTRCLLLAKCFPIKQWFDSGHIDDQQSSTLPALENFCQFLNELAREYAAQTLGANDQEKKMYKENIRQIRVIFVHLHAFDHALELTNQYEIK